MEGLKRVAPSAQLGRHTFNDLSRVDGLPRVQHAIRSPACRRATVTSCGDALGQGHTTPYLHTFSSIALCHASAYRKSQKMPCG